MQPLVTHPRMSDVFAYRDGNALSVAQYVADVHHCANRLPRATHALLACQDRYAFAVGFGAALLAGQICVLPSTPTEDLIKMLAKDYANLYCLTDEINCGIQLPQTYLTPWLLSKPLSSQTNIPQISEDVVAALVFTSGSTGRPIAHRKTWGKLVINVKSEGKRLGIVPDSHFTIVGTVPPQHMYGFESTVLIAMQNAAKFESSKPFYPADIERVLLQTPQPRALVTTPFHLRAWMTETDDPSAVDLMVCATAPLKTELALLAEQKTNAKLLEIYGSTETGQLATRRTTDGAMWRTFDGIQIHQVNETFIASGLQIEGDVEINDVLDLSNEREFILLGRTADMVNVAGKSTTLDYLNHQLLTIAGVLDGAFFIQTEQTEGIGNNSRLAACVVAPSHTAETLLVELRRKIASAFIPRPLKIVEKLPRNTTGKLPRSALLQLLKDSQSAQ